MKQSSLGLHSFRRNQFDVGSDVCAQLSNTGGSAQLPRVKLSNTGGSARDFASFLGGARVVGLKHVLLAWSVRCCPESSCGEYVKLASQNGAEREDLHWLFRIRQLAWRAL